MLPIDSEENYQYILGMRAWASRIQANRLPEDVIGKMSFESHIQELDKIIAEWEKKKTDG